MKGALLSSLLVQGYGSIIGIALMPLYLHYLGAEAFGLVGVFLMVQNWLPLLDLGLSPTLSREMSLFRAGGQDAQAAWARLRSLEWLLGGLALLLLLGLWWARQPLATGWLRLQSLDTSLVAACLFLMGLAAVLRWLSGLYRSGLTGLERQVRVNAWLALFATLRFVAVIPLLALLPSPTLAFFGFQAGVAGLELTVFAATLYRALPGRAESPWPSPAALGAMWPTASAMAFLTGIWVFLTQIDKLILSRLLPLDAFGYFSLAAAVAAGVLLLAPPLNQVLQPRLTILASQGRLDELAKLYQGASQWMALAMTLAGGGLAFFAGPLLWAWTGNPQVAAAAAPLLFWYGLANALSGLCLLPFLLQFAHGYLRLHLLGNLILALTLLPTLILAALHRGAIGTGQVLFVANLLFLLGWVPLVHRRLMPRAVWRWPFRDLLPVVAAAGGAIGLGASAMPQGGDRLATGAWVGLTLVVAAGAGVLAGGSTRAWAKGLLSRGGDS